MVDRDGDRAESPPRLLGHPNGLVRVSGRSDGQFRPACLEELCAVAVNGY
jgi:hypothetical protein